MKEAVYFDRAAPSNPESIEQLRKRHERLLERAAQELEVMKPSLRELVQGIEAAKPDAVVFLDKGARLLGTPIMSVVARRNQDQDWRPQFLFFNDQNLKDITLMPAHNKESRYTKEFLSSLENKRVFFVDESISSGTGAYALMEGSRRANIDAYYYALAQAPVTDEERRSRVRAIEMGHGVNESEAEAIYERMRSAVDSNKNFTHGEVLHHVLFTKETSDLYLFEDLADTDGRGVGLRYGKLDSDAEIARKYTYLADEDLYERREIAKNLFGVRKKENVPEGTYNPERAAANPPSGTTWQEYDRLVREENMRTARALKEMITRAAQESLGA